MRSHMLTVVLALLAGFIGACAYGLVDDVLHFPGSDYFTDVAVDSPHNDDIGFAVEAGITMGLTPDLYGSNVGVSREQMASFQMRDLAAALFLATNLAKVETNLMETPNMERQDIADTLRWGAALLEHEAKARPAEAIGGADGYTMQAERWRYLAAVYFDYDPS